MATPLCSPESDCPGFDLELTPNGGLQIISAIPLAYDTRNHSCLYADGSLNGGQGGYFVARPVRLILTAAERAALAGADLFAGLEVFESDTGDTYVYSFTYSTWVMVSEISAWTTFTAQVKQGASNVNSTPNLLQYTREGRDITALIDVTLGSGGLSSGEIKLTPTSLPPPSLNGTGCVGGFRYKKVTSNVNYNGCVEWDGTDLRLWVHNNSGPFGSAPTIAAQTDDRLWATIQYEANASA